MSLFDKLFGGRKQPSEKAYEGLFKMLDGYQPTFTSFRGGVYESELIRSAIDARATNISKLKVEVIGRAKPALQNKLVKGPNEFHTWSQFLYRLSTILDVHNTAFIVPVFDQYGEISGIYAPLPSKCEIAQYNGTPYLRYEFSYGERCAIELNWCGLMTRHQYRSDFFGESNEALHQTMELINIQNQGIEEGVKSAATYRFMAKLTNFAKAEDLKKERQRFTEENFSKDAKGGGLLLFPNTYNEIKQVDVKPWVIDADQMKVIKDNVYNYFGVNEDILQNKAYGDAWSAFYEGAIEPFAVQFSEVMTRMLFTFREQSQGNMVMATANRLQYMSNADKVAVTTAWADHGLAMVDEIREVWNMPPLPDGKGKAVPVRGEFYDLMTGEKINSEVNGNEASTEQN